MVSQLPAGQLNLVGTASNLTPIYSTSYQELLQGNFMDPTGAAASSGFFNTFNVAGATIDHRGYLTEAELRLIREWLDIGGQYYNDPFEAPLD